MNRLNYFNPYNTKSEYHEDRLTRAFLIVLRYSPSVFQYFYETLKASSLFSQQLPLLADCINENIQIETQKKNIQFETSKLLSVLITNDEFIPNIKIAPSERTAVYDGIISIGNELSIIIETKPNRGHVWEEQLCPSKDDLHDDIYIIEEPLVIKWHTLISWMSAFIGSSRYHYSEKEIVRDFLHFVDSNFSYLNPFDSFHLCKGNHSLIYKRISSILKSIVKDENLVKYHHGWGYYIELPYRSIRKIGMIFFPDRNGFELSLFFADTQGQARALYPIDIDVKDFKERRWDVVPNFHFAFMTSNKIWFGSKSIERYIDYWNTNSHTLSQLPNHDRVRAFLKVLVDNDIVIDQPENMDRIIYKSRMTKINVCPGIGFIYRISVTEAEELDRQGVLAEQLKKQISFCLERVLKKDVSELLN